MHESGAVHIDGEVTVRTSLPRNAHALDQAIHAHVSQQQPVDVSTLDALPEVRTVLDGIGASLSAAGLSTIGHRFRALRRWPILVLAAPVACVVAGLNYGVTGAVVGTAAVACLTAAALSHAWRLQRAKMVALTRLAGRHPELKADPELNRTLAVAIHGIDALKVADPPLARALDGHLIH